MVPRPLTQKEWALSLLVTLSLAGILAVGFIPTSRAFFQYVAALVGPLKGDSIIFWEMASFPLLSALFYLSLPRDERETLPAGEEARLWRTAVFPITVALVFGLFRPEPSVLLAFREPDLRLTAVWYILLVPIGEELLFRGWLYDLVDRLWQGRMATMTNPLPVALWMSSLAFSLWHFQNLAEDSLPFVLFQVVYTFLTGLWLGFLRWRTGDVRFPICAHVVINLAASIF